MGIFKKEADDLHHERFTEAGVELILHTWIDGQYNYYLQIDEQDVPRQYDIDEDDNISEGDDGADALMYIMPGHSHRMFRDEENKTWYGAAIDASKVSGQDEVKKIAQQSAQEWVNNREFFRKSANDAFVKAQREKIYRLKIERDRIDALIRHTEKEIEDRLS